MTRVFISGTGVVTSLGNRVDTVFANVLAGQTGVKAYPEWAKYKGLHSHVGAPAHDYDISRVPRQARRTMSRMSEMATVATVDALSQADLVIEGATPRIAIAMGSTTGSPGTYETYFQKVAERGGPEGQMGTTFFKVMNHSVPANVAAALGFHGPMFSPSSACATGSHAMILGWELLQTGLYDVVIAGGADELNYTSTAVFDIVLAASRAYNDRPEIASRPFDRARDGLVVSEGASVVVLETEDSIRRRKVRPIVEMNGGAYVCSGAHMSQTDATTMAGVMLEALERSKLPKSAIQYVNAHATATRQGDPEETAAVGEIWGKNMPMSSLKGHFGHSLAACGTLEAIMCAQMLRESVLLPTRNLTEVDPNCNQVTHLFEPKNMHKGGLKHVLSNNFAFGGVNTSLVLSLVEGWST